MVKVRKAKERGHFNYGWLDTFHSFSFSDYQDPAHMGFRSLRVINEDKVAPGRGFGQHPHRDMEIITYVLEGALQHKDSTGGGGVIRPGMVQRMSAGTGVTHSEFNASKDESVHLLQIWILPNRKGVPPRYEDRAFPPEQLKNKLRLVVSPDGAEESLDVYQDARVYAAVIEPGQEVTLDIPVGRYAWVQVARGKADVGYGFSAAKDGLECAGEWSGLEAGDGLAASDEKKLALRAEGETSAEFLIFDLA